MKRRLDTHTYLVAMSIKGSHSCFIGQVQIFAVNIVMQEVSYRLASADNIVSILCFPVQFPFMEFSNINVFSFLPLLM